MSDEDAKKEYSNGLTRNYYEIIIAYNSLNAYNDLVESFNRITVYPNEFIGQCYFALYDNCISHTIKVIVHNSKSYTFQNIMKRNKQKVQSLLTKNQITIKFYREMQKKLKQLRTKQFFHIDREYLEDSNKIWAEIDIKEDELNNLIKGVYNVLKTLYLDEISRYPKYTEYNDNSILEFIEKNYNK